MKQITGACRDYEKAPKNSVAQEIGFLHTLFHNATFFGSCIIHILYTTAIELSSESTVTYVYWNYQQHIGTV